MLSAHHASNETLGKQGYSSKSIHINLGVLSVSSHIGLTSLSCTQTFALGARTLLID
ncbi:conserved hypothetical protein [Vibrio crassostreae]|nr:conserved hypothetical protein [Vibrio crassostreae]